MQCKYLDHQVMIRPNGEYRMCCASLENPNKENVMTHSIEEWRNSDTMKQAKLDFANGKFPDACLKCKYQESKGEDSMRTKPRKYGPGVSHLDIRFSNACNLQCLMCHPGSSSKLWHEHQELKSKGLESPWHGVETLSEYNWFNKDLADSLASMKDLREVYLTGGEPMMVKGLDYFISKLPSHVMLRFNTNGTLFNQKLYNEFKRFDWVNLNISLDGIGKVNDYIRWGSNFETIEENILRWQEVAHVNLGPTVQVLNILQAEEYIEWANKRGLEIWDNLLINPQCLNIKNSPDAIKNKISKEYEYAILESADEKQFDEFKKWIGILDKNRGITIKDYLPEVADAYGIS